MNPYCHEHLNSNTLHFKAITGWKSERQMETVEMNRLQVISYIISIHLVLSQDWEWAFGD